MTSVDSALGVGERLEQLVLHHDRSESLATGLGMVCRHGGDRLANIANDVRCKHRLVGEDQAVGELAGNILSRDDRLDTGDRPRGGDIEALDPRMRVQRSQGCSPQRALHR